jgi:hypothetical protein
LHPGAIERLLFQHFLLCLSRACLGKPRCFYAWSAFESKRDSNALCCAIPVGAQEVAVKSFEKSTALTSIDTLDLSDTVFAECSEQVRGSDEPELSLQILEESPHAKELRTAFKAYRSKPRSTVRTLTSCHGNTHSAVSLLQQR